MVALGARGRRRERERERARDDGWKGGGEMRPGSVYEAVTRQMVEGLVEDVAEIKGRVNGLLFMVAGAIVVDVALRVAGVD